MLSATTYERFDLNSVALQGATIEKIRPFATSQILIHLKQPKAAISLNSDSKMLDQISLVAGDRVQVHGYFRDCSYTESFESFLARAGHLSLLEKYPSLAALKKSTVRRSLTVIIPDGTIAVEPEQGDDPDNFARLEGIVAKTWVYSTHVYARLAVYDQHEAQSAGSIQDESEALPRRKAHYVTVQFTDGLADGRPVSLKPKMRVRINGSVLTRVYSESLREWLRYAKKTDFIHNFENPELLDQVRARYGQVVLEVRKMIIYS